MLIAEGRPAEVLLIDDHRGDVVLAAHAFKKAKVSTHLTTAATGEMALTILTEAVDHSGKRLPDLILLDLGLPKMGGMDVLTHIKSDPRLKHIPVVVMSNSGAGHNILKSYQLHANAYVIKPVDLGSFLKAINLIEEFFFVLARVPDEKM